MAKHNHPVSPRLWQSQTQCPRKKISPQDRCGNLCMKHKTLVTQIGSASWLTTLQLHRGPINIHVASSGFLKIPPILMVLANRTPPVLVEQTFVEALNPAIQVAIFVDPVTNCKIYVCQPESKTVRNDFGLVSH
jgi:hypothetical protein